MKLNSFFFNDTATTEIYTLSLHDALPISIAIPNFVKARTASQKNACMANLKQMDGSKAAGALARTKATSDTRMPSDLCGANAYIRDKPLCPGRGTYTIAALDTTVSCSLSS